ncbi:DNA polymerase III subunit beta [Sphaerospermopsis kisseleviana CS-549]|jgi:DNA polymerase-3 subunit beta|uniref:Beta sliding clamp n=3 Tax=Sphaerospermopsis TaxID=752201 RepID=A0A479ZU77_9CYAN|nr:MULTISPECIES: DNA polymerase III subunit beta [Sphaerospermopsis]BAZ82500.1 DNA polymerase IF1 subunit beta [Sphaerospermopsis kisseleviana NIES-73]MBD2133561.1 DNA polymerase III subunit beta [Sphaerospermopsis sp. FACHB-1094]MBD2143731.1 DNA polymerase III subunit beta [Sphaerospermopsis sp. FACHB-1194]MBE9235401.1 DNA polymerase III subunit beta [Sphaerospermopsis aphanizomenoides LEGE 00250]MDB9441365.1 DNA polymerase III subunit beta [Sphaerospermopsis kisseleviana CS-549]
MKLVCSQSDLSTNLSLVSRAVPSRPTHPILANVLLQADEETNQVSLTAFDLSLGIRTSFSAEVIEGGAIALPAKLLLDITSRLPEGEISLDDESADNTGEGIVVTLKPKSGKYQVRAMGAEEFPELPVIESSESIQLTTAALIEGLKGSLFATSTDETKQVLTGLHLTVKQDTLEFAATDGHRLAVLETANERPLEGSEQLEVTVPARALRELQRMLAHSSSEEAVSLYLDQGQIVFAWQNQRLTSRTLEGQYPAYRQLIPRQFERQVVLERKQFISTLERIAVLADQKNNIVKISIDNENQEITLSCEAQDVGSGTESMPAQISGEDIDIAFNVKYLMEGLKELPSTEIQMHLNQSLTPVIFTPLGGLKMTYLAMPVQLRN